MRLTHVKAIVLSGLTWMFIGAFLLYKGLYYSVMCILAPPAMLHFIAQYLGTVQNAILLCIATGLVLGVVKARFVLIKTIQRVVKGIMVKPSPLKLTAVYSKRYCFLILSMMLLGLTLRFLPISNDIRGVIDVTIGSALLNGALIYFRLAVMLKKEM